MIKKGFTLGEVLITLGVVGIVAAITIPMLNSSVSQKTIGPALAKAVNNLKVATKNALIQERKITLDEINPNIILVLDSQMNGMVSDDESTFYGRDGITYTDQSGEPDTAGNIESLPEKYSGSYYRIMIDINGDNSPNIPGTDQFLIYIDTKGSVILSGSKESETYGAKYIGPNRRPGPGGAGGGQYYLDYKIDCKDPETTNLKFLCTGTIMRDGWEVKYK